MNATTFRPSGLPLRSAFLLLGIGIACLGALDLAIGRADPSDARFGALLSKADSALVAERWDTAESLFSKARAARPQRADLAAWHAASLGQLGRIDEAFTALAEAVRLGYADVSKLRWDFIFQQLRSDSRFGSALAAAQANESALKEKSLAADAPLPLANAPSFPTLSALNESFDREEELLSREDFRASKPSRLRLRMRRIAALERYVSEHPEATDRAEARTEALRAWWVRALPWRDDSARDLAVHAAALADDLSMTPDQRREARFYTLIAQAFVGAEDDGLCATTPPSEQGCQRVLDAAAAMASDSEGGPWSARASALQAICVQVLRPSDVAAFRVARDRWTAAALPRTSPSRAIRGLDATLHTLNIAASLKAFGPPPFQLPTPDGTLMGPHTLRGKVALLSFWAPSCPPCLLEVQPFREVYAAHREEGFEILGVAFVERGESGRKWLTRYMSQRGITWPNVVAGQDWYA